MTKKSKDTIEKILSVVTYDPDGSQFLLNGKDIKRKKSNGYWAVRVKIGNLHFEAYCHTMIYFIVKNQMPKKNLSFADGDKNNLNAINIVVKKTDTPIVRVEKEPLETIYIKRIDVEKVTTLLEEAGITFRSKKTKVKPVIVDTKKGTFDIECTVTLGIPCVFIPANYAP